MKKSSMRSWLACGIAVALAAPLGAAMAGCSGRAEPDSAPAPRARYGAVSEERRDHKSTASPYTFFVATRWAGEYRLTAVNDAAFGCGRDTAATSCIVSSVDLSALDLDPAVASSLLDLIGRDANAPVLVLTGAVTAGTLAVQEIWRAPAPVRFWGPLLHVSHDPAQALVINQWTAEPIGPIDFSRAPLAEYCDRDEDAGVVVCRQSYEGVEGDVGSQTGVLLAGHARSDGTMRVEQYFQKISIGEDQDGDGYSFCTAGQKPCSSGACSTTGTCLHWGGRGLMRIYLRSADPTFDSWLVTTGQLRPTDWQAPP